VGHSLLHCKLGDILSSFPPTAPGNLEQDRSVGGEPDKIKAHDVQVFPYIGLDRLQDTIEVSELNSHGADF
jgi:hypothetical protein